MCVCMGMCHCGDEVMEPKRIFHREKRYVVLKNKDIAKYLSNSDMLSLNYICMKIEEGRLRDGRPNMQAVVVESDWPEYDPTWKAIEHRMTMGMS